jgi:hypothetical protein
LKDGNVEYQARRETTAGAHGRGTVSDIGAFIGGSFRHDVFGTWQRLAGTATAVAVALACLPASAGTQVEERLAPSVVTVLSAAIRDQAVPVDYGNRAENRPWMDEMSRRLASKSPMADARRISRHGPL